MKRKIHADIGGKMWDVNIAFCAGCAEYVIQGYCAWEGNGCRFPDRRIERPESLFVAYITAKSMSGLTDEEIAQEIKRKDGEAP